MPDYKEDDIMHFYNHTIDTLEFKIWFLSTYDKNFGPYKESFKRIQTDYIQSRNKLTDVMEVYYNEKENMNNISIKQPPQPESEPNLGQPPPQRGHTQQAPRLLDPRQHPHHRGQHPQHHNLQLQNPRQHQNQQHHQPKQYAPPDFTRFWINPQNGQKLYLHPSGRLREWRHWQAPTATGAHDHLETTLDDTATAYDVPLDLTA